MWRLLDKPQVELSFNIVCDLSLNLLACLATSSSESGVARCSAVYTLLLKLAGFVNQDIDPTLGNFIFDTRFSLKSVDSLLDAT